jgi:GNAT superfamily N-acetyltransferase
LLVVEADDRVCGSVAFYPDASAQGLGWPPGWAGGRTLAVHPAARGHGVARVLVATCERLAQDSGAPVFAFCAASFMTSAIACTSDSATAERQSSISTGLARPALAVLAVRSVNARLAWHCLSAWCYLGRVRDQFCPVL